MRIISTISLLLVSAWALAQPTLLVPPGMDSLDFGSGALLVVGGDAVVSRDAVLDFQSDGGFEIGGNLVIEDGSEVNFANGNETDPESMRGLHVGGTFQNFGSLLLGTNTSSVLSGDVTLSPASITNSDGILEVAGNWNSLGQFVNGSGSEFIAAGSADQLIEFVSVFFPRLTVAGPGVSTLRAESIIIEENGQLDFAGGVLRVAESTDFLVETGATITGGSDDSYFDGRLRIASEGSDDLNFPIGDGTQYNPIALRDIEAGTGSYTIAAELTSPNTLDPVPAEDVVGVSSRNMWTVQLENGAVDSATLYINFADEDLSDEAFVNFNPVNAEFVVPVVTVADSLPGEFVSLGASSLEASDSLTFGMITSEEKIAFTASTKYIALGRAPVISPNLRYFIPDVFAPGDFRPENQTMRVFGEFIDESADFEFTIYNEFNSQMYTTNSFREANEVGWDGTFNGVEQPSGTYMWILRATIDQVRYEDRGLFYLVR